MYACPVLLMLASQRIESVVSFWFWTNDVSLSPASETYDTEAPTKRGATPSAIEWMILAWVSGKCRWASYGPYIDQEVHQFHVDLYHILLCFTFLLRTYTHNPSSGLIWSEVKQLWDIGLQEYVNDMWNVIDFVTNSLYVATVALRVVSYFQVSQS